jgi:hypothetical protein
MRTQRALLLAGSVWELVRFFILATLFAAVLRDAVQAGPWVYPWLAAIGSGSLLVAAAAGMLALFPDRFDPLILFLRLGKVLGAFSLLALLVSGALRATAGSGAGAGAVVLPQGIVLLAVLVLDIAFLGVLFSWRRGAVPPEPPPIAYGKDLPEYSETEVGNYH